MGKKRKIISKPQKFGRKFAAHPATVKAAPEVENKPEPKPAPVVEPPKPKAEPKPAPKPKKVAEKKEPKVKKSPLSKIRKTKPSDD